MNMPANGGGGYQDGDIQSLVDFGSRFKEMRKLLGEILVPTNVLGVEELCFGGHVGLARCLLLEPRGLADRGYLDC